MEEKNSGSPPRSLRRRLQELKFGDDELEESEPYLGPAWAVAMLILYLLKRAFPADQYSLLWWVQIYIITIVVAVMVFTLVKRHQFYKAERLRLERRRQEKAAAAQAAGES